MIGGVWAWIHPGANIDIDLTVVATVVVWLWYAVGLHFRFIAGWRGGLAAVFGVGGFVGLSLLIGAASLVLRGWHGLGGGLP